MLNEIGEAYITLGEPKTIKLNNEAKWNLSYLD